MSRYVCSVILFLVQKEKYLFIIINSTILLFCLSFMGCEIFISRVFIFGSCIGTVIVFFHQTVHGGWSSWNSYSTCSKTCKGGKKTRSRTCTSPAPRHNGRSCSGSSSQTADCNSAVRCPCKSTNFHTDYVKKCNSKRLPCLAHWFVLIFQLYKNVKWKMSNYTRNYIKNTKIQKTVWNPNCILGYFFFGVGKK